MPHERFDTEMDPTYRQILDLADSHFGRVTASQPQNLSCRLGCTMCCEGLFEISAADVAVIADGLSRLDEETRAGIEKRARRVVEQTAHPNLREVSPEEKEDFFARTDKVVCPALGSGGACLIYESRPLVCRTFGLPIREGPRYIGDECELNFTASAPGEKQAAAWDLEWEDVLGPEDEFTVPEAIVLAARMSVDRYSSGRGPK